MTSERWAVSDVDDYDQNAAGRPLPSLVSLHFVRSAVRRRWWVCVLFAMLGLLMAMAYLVSSSASHVAKAALVLEHDPQVDSSRAMSTDVSLLRTRTVARGTIASLGLDMTPDEFLQSVTADPVSSELLSVTVTGPSSAEAVRRLEALTSTYLSFRAEQLSAQSNFLVDGMRQRVQQLQDEMAQRSKEIDSLAHASNGGGTKLSDRIAQRAYVQEQIETLQQSIQDATLRNASVVSSSRVVDPAAVDTAGVKRRIALTLASGLIGGAALGCGIVLFFAITSNRLRRRSDVAAALEAPLVSLGRIAPLSKRWLWLPHLRTLDSHRADERQRLVRAIEMELSTPRRAGQLAVACIDNGDEVRFAVASATADLIASGCTVALIDLSERGSLFEVVPSVANSGGSLTMLRPRGVPALAAGPDDLGAVGRKDGSSPSLELNDVTLVFADLDPSVGAEHLAAWTQRVIVAVTAGRSSAEKVRTMAELVRTAGLDLRLAALLRTEGTDDSSAASFDRRTPLHLSVDQDQPRVASEELVDHVHEASAATATAVAGATPEEKAAAELTLAEGDTASEEQIATEEQPATSEEQVGIEKELVEEDAVTADEHATVADERTQEQVGSAEEEPADEQTVTTDEQLVATDDQPTTDQPAADESAVPEEEAHLDEPAAAADLQAVAQEEATSDKQVVDERQPTEEQAATAEELPAAEEQPAADHETDKEGTALKDQVSAEEHEAVEEERAVQADASTNEQQPAAEEQAAAADEHVVATDEQPATEELLEVAQQTITEEQAADGVPAEEQLSAEAQMSVEEPLALSEEEGLDEQPATAAQVDTAKEESTSEEQMVVEEPVATDENLAQWQPDERRATEEPAALIEDETADEQQAARADDDAAAEEQEAGTEEQPAEEEPAPEEQPAAELQIVPDLQPAEERVAAKETTAADQQAIDEEQTAEPDYVPDALEEGTVDGWNLYFTRYPPAHGAQALESEDGESDWSWDWDDLDDLDSQEVSTANKANFEADGHESGNGSAHRTNAEGDGRVVVEESARNGKKPTTVARTRTKSRTRRRSRA